MEETHVWSLLGAARLSCKTRAGVGVTQVLVMMDTGVGMERGQLLDALGLCDSNKPPPGITCGASVRCAPPTPIRATPRHGAPARQTPQTCGH